MSHTYRNVPQGWHDDRDGKDWQAMRGPRHGNNRKMYAKLKHQDRKDERAQARVRFKRELEYGEQNF